MRGQSIRYQNILTVQNNSKHNDSIMLLMTSLNEVCFTMPQWENRALLRSVKKKLEFRRCVVVFFCLRRKVGVLDILWVYCDKLTAFTSPSLLRYKVILQDRAGWAGWLACQLQYTSLWCICSQTVQRRLWQNGVSSHWECCSFECFKPKFWPYLKNFPFSPALKSLLKVRPVTIIKYINLLYDKYKWARKFCQPR